MISNEIELRGRLGIPDDAKWVIIFGESSHWDPDWLLTSKQYYRLAIKSALDKALEELSREPKRVFSPECTFFVKMYWDRNPDKHDKIRNLVNEGRLRFTGSGVTTPDTLLPEPEALIRDYLIGQEWLRENGMNQEPTLAYLPDDFGHSPTLPNILSALGYKYAAMTRIDGSYFMGIDYRLRSWFPRPGSSAELLARELKTSDFIWRGTDGSKVICHWNPVTYFQGDMLAYAGIGRSMGRLIGIHYRKDNHIAKRIKGYARKLIPLAKTPYLFCPMGGDFNGPVPRLVKLLDRYNSVSYPHTGIYAVNAAMDDYLELVSHYEAHLPEIELDANPCFMGFYSARPEMKQRCRKLVHDLGTADMLLAQASEKPTDDVEEDLSSAWETAAVANHHDFITGTSPNRVWNKEQRPWLIKAQEKADKIIKGLVQQTEPSQNNLHSAQVPEWEFVNGKLRVNSPFYSIEMDENKGGCITSWVDPEDGTSLLSGQGADLVSYKDLGGLWRMGHEFIGGTLKMKNRTARNSASIKAVENNGHLEVTVQSVLEKRKVTRRLWFTNDSPLVKMRIEGSANKRRTVTCRFTTSQRPLSIFMDVPGGAIHRPLVKVFDPTFWPARNFAHIRDHITGRGMAVFMGGPAVINANSNGLVEWIAIRNTPKEKAFGFIPVMAFPAKGADSGKQILDCAVMFTRKGDWVENKLDVLARNAFKWDTTPGPERENSFITIDKEDVEILAIKRASRGEGVIVRLLALNTGGEVKIECKGKIISKATLCDARERDIKDIKASENEVALTMDRAIVTARLLFN